MLSRGWGKVINSSVLNKGLYLDLKKKARFLSVLLMDTFVLQMHCIKETKELLKAMKQLKEQLRKQGKIN